MLERHDMHDSLTPIIAHFGKKDGELLVAGRPISRILEEHGSPVYLYDRSILRWRSDLMRKHLPADLYVTYAVKANPNLEVLKEMGDLYYGIDIASQGEMEMALKAGITADRMSFAGPGKSPAELRFVIGKDIGTISAEGEREVDHIEAIAKETGKTVRVMIRVNPAFELSRAGLKMGGGSKQFGVDSERVPALVARLLASKHMKYCGIHIFSGTQNLSPESILETQEKILDYASALAAETGAAPEIVNLGGGFGIPYFKGDAELDLEAVGKGMSALIGKYRAKLPGTHFKIELGRYLVGECGVYAARILYRKESRGQNFLIMDGGMHHHLPASGNMNQSPIRRQMHVVVANNLDGAVERVNVVGPLCTPLDNFGLNVELPKAGEGDVIAVLNSGAYGFSISPLGFLSHKPPKEVVL